MSWSTRVQIALPIFVYVSSLILSWILKEGVIWIIGLAISFFLAAGLKLYFINRSNHKKVDVIEAIFFIFFGTLAVVIGILDIPYNPLTI